MKNQTIKKQTPPPLANALYVIATPIGNLRDITLRALDTLGQVDVLACEDTRTTQKLLNAYDIKTATIPYHDHNGDTMRPQIIARLEQGQSVGLVSDAGTPLISDPGFKLVRDVMAGGHTVIPLPGACSPITALCGAGLPSDVFTFAGFLPQKSTARKTALQAYADTPHTTLFFESASRLCATLADMQAVLGNRPVTVAREITKLYEEFQHGTFETVINHYTATPPRGEIVIVVGGNTGSTDTDHDIDALLSNALKTHRIKDASTMVAEITNRPKKEIYQRALQLKNDP